MSLITRVVLLVSILAVLASALWYVQQRSPFIFNNLTETLQQTREVLTPPPLRGSLTQPGGALTRAGVFTETNRQRAINNVGTLAANAKLDQAAESKLRDMFTQQYFEHVGPDGKGPSDWVEGVGYEYIRVGENLALGNFGSDAELVQAWMDSPGHRANILHTGFSEIGIAVGQGTFEGHTTWLAVQTFALPASACPAPESKLGNEIDALKATIESTGSSLAEQQRSLEQQSQVLADRLPEIEALFTRARQAIEAGNQKIAEGNRIYQETGSREQAQPYWDEGERLHDEGEALLKQAQDQQAEYNAAVDRLREQQTKYNDQVAHIADNQATIKTLITRYNQQVKAFNQCAK